MKKLKRLALIFFFIGCWATTKAQTNTFPSSGDVGIGTITPEDKLHLEGAYGKWLFHGNGRRLELHTIDEATNHYPWIGFYDHTGARGAYFGNGVPGSYIDLRLENGTDLGIKGGSVGIGTTNPSSKLHLREGNTGGAPHSYSLLTVEGVSTPMISILAKKDARSYYGFSDEDDPFVAGIQYNHFEDKMLFRVNNHSTSDSDLTIASTGYVGIGTTHPSARLAVNGTTKTREIIVTEQSSEWPDYVFSESYKMQALRELEAFVKSKKHLPGMPTREEVEQTGQHLGAIQAKLLQKIEELTLYTIEQQKLIDEQHKENDDLKNRLEKIEQKLNSNNHN